MDPDQCLKEILENAAFLVEEICPDDGNVRDMAEKIMALDRWLRQGGFLPTAWRFLHDAVAHDDHQHKEQG